MVVGFNCEITVNSKCGEQPKPQRSAEKSTEKNTKKEMNVSIYSTGDDVPLKEVFQKIFDKEKGAACIDHKSADAELRKYFKSVFAEYDEDRVYTNDSTINPFFV